MKVFWRLFHQAILLGIVISFTSCGGKKVESDLSVTVSGESFILPGASKNCTEILRGEPTDGTVVTGSVQAPRVEFRSATLRWESSKTLDIIAIQLSVEDKRISGGSYLCTIQGDELDSLFTAVTGDAEAANGNNTYVRGRITGTPPVSNITNQKCKVSCSSLVIDDKFSDKEFSLKGTLKVIATETDSKNAEAPVRAETTVTINHFPN